MKTTILFLCAAALCNAKDTRPLITTESTKFHNRKMSCGERYDKRGNYVAVNRGGLQGDTIWLCKGFMQVRAIVCDRFNTEKDKCEYLKIDCPAWMLQTLGMRGKGRLDSVEIMNGKVRTVFK